MLKKILIASTLLVVSACSSVSNLNQSNILKESSSGVFIADIGAVKDGASFSVKINPSDSFKVKANTDGTPPKTGNDIKSLAVYLVQSSTDYSSGGDPIGDKVAGPFNLNRTGTSAYTVTFSNVGPNATGKKYYVAVRAFDAVGGTGGTGVEIIKNNNGSATAWTGTTATTSLKVAVSSSGVAVGTDFKVDTTTALTVGLNLLDGIGAGIEATVTPNAGATPAPADITAS